MSLALREVGINDGPFLFRLYASTRQEEIAAWGWNQARQEMFLRMQFRAWQQGLLAQASTTEDRIVLIEDQPIGRIVVIRSSTESTSLTLHSCPSIGVPASALR